MSIRVCLTAFSMGLLLSVLPVIADPAPGDSLNIPDIETFMQIGAASEPAISADGNRVFFDTFMSGVDQVYEILPSGWPYQLTVFVDGIDFYVPSYSGDHMIVGASIGGSEQSDFYLLDTNTGSVSTLKAAEGVRHGSPVWSPDEKYVYFRSNQENGTDFFIYRIAIEDKRVDKISSMQGWNNATDISADGNRLLMTHFSSNVDSDLYLLDLANKAERHLTDHSGDYVFVNGRLDPDLEYVYFLTNKNRDGMVRVARMKIGDDDIEFLNSDSPWETEEMDMTRDARFLAWVENVDGYGLLYIMNLRTGRKWSLDHMKGVVQGLQFSDDGKLVFAFASASRTFDVWMYDVAGGELKQLTHSSYAGVDRTMFVEPELIKYRSFDDLEIPAFLFVPEDWDGQPLPFVIHAHGGPESQFRPSFQRHFQYLILNGYGIIAPNIRGSSGYGIEYMQMDDYKKRKDSIKDIYEAARWLVDNGYAEYGKIAVKGGSYGGYVTLAALVDYPEIFGAGICSVGISNFVTFLQNTADYRRAIREAEYGPLSDEEFLTEISPLTNAEQIRAPLLIAHGENDPRVPVDEARQIARSIKARGGTVETLIFPDEGHGIGKLSNRLIYYRKMVEFLDQHIKNGGLPAYTP
ncbi:MAG: S9 family peptidase [bacterium]|jgi:dipeptidyl aminopeptidase/acylaminoacyl peptidase